MGLNDETFVNSMAQPCRNFDLGFVNIGRWLSAGANAEASPYPNVQG